MDNLTRTHIIMEGMLLFGDTGKFLDCWMVWHTLNLALNKPSSLSRKFSLPRKFSVEKHNATEKISQSQVVVFNQNITEL